MLSGDVATVYGVIVSTEVFKSTAIVKVSLAGVESHTPSSLAATVMV